MRYLGARVVLTPRAQKGFGIYVKAKELADANGWFLARQFETCRQRAETFPGRRFCDNALVELSQAREPVRGTRQSTADSIES